MVTLFKFYACSNFPNHIILQHTRPWQIWQKWCFDCPKFVRIILVGLPQQSEQTYITYTQNISYIFHDFSSFGFVALVVLCVLYVHSSEINCLCLMKWPSETLQNLPYISGITKTHTLYGFRIPKVCANIDISKSRSFLFLMSVCICVIYFVRPKEEARKWKQQNFLPLMVLGGLRVLQNVALIYM